jgi:hypothetical protein
VLVASTATAVVTTTSRHSSPVTQVITPVRFDQLARLVQLVSLQNLLHCAARVKRKFTQARKNFEKTRCFPPAITIQSRHPPIPEAFIW